MRSDETTGTRKRVAEARQNKTHASVDNTARARRRRATFALVVGFNSFKAPSRALRQRPCILTARRADMSPALREHITELWYLLA